VIFQYLKSYNIPVAVIGQTERYTVSYPVIAARSNQYKTNNNGFYLDGQSVSINKFLNTNLKGYYIDILNKDSFPPLSPKNVTYMRDKDHVTKYGADIIVQKIRKDPVWQRFFKKIYVLFSVWFFSKVGRYIFASLFYSSLFLKKISVLFLFGLFPRLGGILRHCSIPLCF
jgi:hypothetical protein